MNIDRSAIVGVLAALLPLAASAEPVASLRSHTHIHGLSIDRTDPAYLLVATHHGLYRAGPDGNAELVSPVQDLMGFTPDPRDPNALFASGHPARGGNLGVVASSDRGNTWKDLSPGVNGPVDFHQMTVSLADHRTMYGVFGNLQISRDAGKSWAVVGKVPDKLIDLSASATSAETVYAATEFGLLVSVDAGKSWKPLLEGSPITMVETTQDGTIYAFSFRKGLTRAKEGVFEWSTIAGDWDRQYILHLAIDPTDASRMIAATGESQVIASKDQGATWRPFGR